MRMNANDLINELHRCLLVTDSGDIGLTTKLEGKLFFINWNFMPYFSAYIV